MNVRTLFTSVKSDFPAHLMPATPGFDRRLSAAMEAAGIGKTELSRKSGVSRPTIDEWLGGALPLQDRKVRRLAQTLGMPFDELWGTAAELHIDERTRLVQLESAIRRMREILDEIEVEGVATVEGPPLGMEEDFPPSAPFAGPLEEEKPARQTPRRRRGKSA